MTARAIINPDAMRRNLQTPRSGMSPAEYARAVHHEELTRAAVWPERLMYLLAGVCIGASLILKALP